VPLWLVGSRGFATDAPVVFWSLTVFSLGAGVGGVVAGPLERRLPRQLLITGSMLAALVPLGLLFLTPPGGRAYYLCAALAGALVNGGLPLMIVAAQDLSPHAVGAATGLMMGFTWGMAGRALHRHRRVAGGRGRGAGHGDLVPQPAARRPTACWRYRVRSAAD
jgi:MFS family permease